VAPHGRVSLSFKGLTWPMRQRTSAETEGDGENNFLENIGTLANGMKPWPGDAPGSDHRGTSAMKTRRSQTQAVREPYSSIPAAGSIAAAVCFALYGAPRSAAAEAAEHPSDVLQEVTVTATRREQALEAVPYSLSVVTAEQLSAFGASDIASLSTTVPGL